MHKLLLLNKRFPYFLPIASAFALLIALPPFNLWPFILVALVPIYIFIFQGKNVHKIFSGVLFWVLIFSGSLSFMLFSSFTWIPEAYLFSNSVKLLAVPIVLFTSIVAALLVAYLSKALIPRTPFERALIFSIFFTVINW